MAKKTTTKKVDLTTAPAKKPKKPTVKKYGKKPKSKSPAAWLKYEAKCKEIDQQNADNTAKYAADLKAFDAGQKFVSEVKAKR